MVATASAIDSRRFGKYTLLAHLASGGMGELYLARPGPHSADQIIVIKRVLPHLARDSRFNEMLLSEARIAARLSHPNVCEVFDVGDVGGRYYIAMEYLEGVSLLHLLSRTAKRNEYIDPALAAGLLVQAAEGLHAAHSLRDADGRALDLVHRDVSPGNVFVTAAGRVKVLDFGVAKSTESQVHTRTGAVKGKWAYMSPEQIRRSPLDHRTDIFALGILAFECFTGRRLFRRDSEYATAQAITEQDAPSILAYRPQVHGDLAQVVARALSRDPNGRFETARAFAQAVEASCGLPLAQPDEIASYIETLFADELAERRLFLETLSKGDAPDLGRTFESLPTLIEPESPIDEEDEVLLVVERDEVPTQLMNFSPKLAERRTIESTGQIERPRTSWLAPLLASLVGASVVAGVAYASLRPADDASVVVYRGGVSPESESESESESRSTPPAPPEPSTTLGTAKTADREATAAAANTATEPRKRAKARTTAARARPAGQKQASRDPFKQAVRSHQSELLACFREHAQQVAGAPKLAIRFQVRKDGTVVRADLLPAELADTTLGSCLTAAVRDVRFPADDADATVTIPLQVRKR